MQDQKNAEVGGVPGAEISGVNCEPVLFIVRFPDPGEEPGLEEPVYVSRVKVSVKHFMNLCA
jgi:hypothetical protein